MAGTVLEWGTGALNVDACRVGTDDKWKESTRGASDSIGTFKTGERTTEQHPAGRWPPHLLLTHSATCTETECAPDCPVLELGRQSGELRARGNVTAKDNGSDYSATSYQFGGMETGDPGDTGTAARFFPTFRYSAKPSRAERDAGITTARKSAGEATGRKDGSKGLDSPRAGAGRTSGARNHHPTVKGIDLMRWLVRLITPEGGTGMDFFGGSGTTGIAYLLEEFSVVVVEKEAEYVDLVRQRIRHWAPMWASEGQP